MFFLRLAVLAFLVAYGVGMGSNPVGRLNSFGELVVFTLVFTVPAMYMLPTYEAWQRKHPNLMSIALLNFLLGWTALGWVIAVVWAYKRVELPPVEVVAPARAEPIPSGSSVEQLERLASLRDRGVLSAEEFEAEKAKLLRA